MKHPEWVTKHKIPNSEIRCIKGRYYLYGIKSVWSPEKKRAKKVTLKQIGVIDEEYGLIPTGMSRKGRVPAGQSKLKEDAPLETNFLDDFSVLDDPRADRNQLYTMSEILLVSVLAIVCGAEGWSDIEDFGKAKIAFLRNYLEYQNGTPSDDTVRRMFRHINPEPFKRVFAKWVNSLAKTADAKVIAIDGKSSRRSYDDDTKMLHMVSAFATEARVVLGQEKVSEKSNEITAIPKLLELFDIKGRIITIDAMGCQHAIANKIVKKEGDYIFSLKGNQGGLSEDVTLFFTDTSHNKTIVSGIDYDKGHGRIETRKCFICNDVKWLQKRHEFWTTINSIIRIESTREIKGESTTESRYYIASLKNLKPDDALKAIRQHWGVENTLHWILDMSFNEDYSRIRKGNAPQVMAIMRHIALNLLQRFKTGRQSIKRLRKICSWDDQSLAAVITKGVDENLFS